MRISPYQNDDDDDDDDEGGDMRINEDDIGVEIKEIKVAKLSQNSTTPSKRGK
jgi:hypothetical protein